tara:strand:- start:177 stop:290 length:114 start_codon:yes stop_codon:yes gene_type:complete
VQEDKPAVEDKLFVMGIPVEAGILVEADILVEGDILS